MIPSGCRSQLGGVHRGPPTTRKQHNRRHLRYGSDLTDTEWAIVEPFLPPPSHTGRPRRWPMREIINAIFYVLRSRLPMADGA